MSCKEKQEEYVALFTKLVDPLSQSDYLINLGMSLARCKKIRQEKFKIRGCKTSIWLNCEKKEGKVSFEADSDSLLVKGILKIMHSLYSDVSLKEIMECPPSFLNNISDDVIYPEIKNNGIKKCYEGLISCGGK